MNDLNFYLTQLNKAHDEYEKVFGIGSLTNAVSYFDPVNPDIENTKAGIRILNKAIRTGKPLPKMADDFNILY